MKLTFSTKNESAFTLIELLTVITIVGILAAVALPQYQRYKRKAFDLRALSDLRNVAAAEELYFLENEEYLACETQNCTQLPGIPTLSRGVLLSVKATPSGFLGEARHPQGSGKKFQWNTELGGFIE